MSEREEIKTGLTVEEYADFLELAKLIFGAAPTEIALHGLELDDKIRNLQEHSVENELLKSVYLSGKFLVVNDISTSTFTKAGLSNDRKINFFAGFPISNHEIGLIGILTLMDLEPKEITEEQIRALNLITNNIAKLIQEKNKNNEEKNFTKLIHESDDLICIAGTNGYFKKVNHAFEEVLGWKAGKLEGSCFFDIIHHDDQNLTQREIEKLKRGLKSVDFIIRLRMVSGKYRKIQWYATPSGDEIFAIGRDITKKLENNHLARINDEKLKLVFENSKGLICTHDVNGKFLSINNAAAESLGYSVKELLSLSLFDLLPITRREALKMYLSKIKSEGVASGEMLILNKSGDIRVWMFKNVFINEPAGEDYIIGNALDITNQHMLEKDLRFTKEILEQTSKVARVGGWSLELHIQKLYWTTMTKTIHELGDDFLPDLVSGINFYKEGESREKISSAVKNALEHGENFDLELQIITAKGNEKWVRAMGTAEFKDGECKRLFGTFQDIDLQKRSSIALAEAKKMLDNVLNSASEISIIATDTTGTITLFNKGAERMLGYDASSMVGRQNLLIIHDYSEIKKREQEILAESGKVAKGFGVFTEVSELNNSGKKNWTYIKKNGQRLTVSLVVTEVKDADNNVIGYLGIANDITENRKIEAALASERARLAAFVAHVPAAVAMLDKEMKYVAVSNQWIEDYKMGNREIVGLSHYELFPNFSEESLKYHQNVLSGAIERKEEDIFIEPDTKVEHYTSWEMRPWYEKSDTIAGMMLFTRDVTETILYRENLKKAKLQAEAASIAKSEFLANMSHEIRTPLNGVIGFTDLILKTKLDYSQYQYLSIVNQSANSLLNIINDILDFSKIEAGKLELDYDKFDVYEIAAQSAEIVDYQIKSKGLEMLLNIPPDLPRFVWGDAVRLKQIFVNLLGNAVKFTKQGEIELEVEILSVKDGLSNFRFSVRDTGIGIPQKSKLRIFEAFSQADNSTTRKYGGTGLGLNISNKLLNLMDSCLQLISEENVGSTFYFDLSLKSEAGAKTEWENIDAFKNILVVDDNANNRTIINKMLNQQGIKIHEADCGDQALAMLAAGSKYDAMLIDFHMPGIDGIETVKKIRESHYLNHHELPVILLHSSAEDGSIKTACDELDIRQRLVKPLKAEQVFSALSRLKVKDDQRLTDQHIAYTPTVNDVINILVVEDDDFNMFLITTILNDLMPNAIITEARNGLEGIQFFKNKRPSIVFMDIRMPEMDGYEATKHIRLINEAAATVPIIAATAGNAKNEKDLCLSAGMDDYVTKPFKEEQIIEILEKWLMLSFV
ncbi:PAS domain S-box protein [Pedobacter rhodius]|uniref:histidine kinase n=1 Tax=Pedobacter rhodius TaxID=3004098 RepID=A0ABT4KYN4_9SPHI|nr:PAS domain S-box protein [Pedobacter sp. SJ11]MCZ4222973.1 PAS domain S-box protein [Pedobacter sp. SJ11]